MMAEWLLGACALASIFLMARNLAWAVQVVRAGMTMGGHVARAEMMEERVTPQWRLRMETLALCLMAWAGFSGQTALAVALLFWLLTCRVVRWAEGRCHAAAALVLVLVLAAVWQTELGVRP